MAFAWSIWVLISAGATFTYGGVLIARLLTPGI
jgi:hypothetical protein